MLVFIPVWASWFGFLWHVSAFPAASFFFLSDSCFGFRSHGLYVFFSKVVVDTEDLVGPRFPGVLNVIWSRSGSTFADVIISD